MLFFFFFFQAEDGIRDHCVTGVQTCALPISRGNQYFSDLLDKLNIERGVANRAMMADYLDPKRFPWVFFADSFMWPFNNRSEERRVGKECRSRWSAYQ